MFFNASGYSLSKNVIIFTCRERRRVFIWVVSSLSFVCIIFSIWEAVKNSFSFLESSVSKKSLESILGSTNIWISFFWEIPQLWRYAKNILFIKLSIIKSEQNKACYQNSKYYTFQFWYISKKQKWKSHRKNNV